VIFGKELFRMKISVKMVISEPRQQSHFLLMVTAYTMWLVMCGNGVVTGFQRFIEGSVLLTILLGRNKERPKSCEAALIYAITLTVTDIAQQLVPPIHLIAHQGMLASDV